MSNISFDSAMSGLSAARKGMEVVSNNLANENTADYRKQTLKTSEAGPVTSGSFVGTGVKVDGVLHNLDSILYYNFTKQIGPNGFNSQNLTISKSIESVFQDNNELGLKTDLESFFTTASDLKNNSDDMASRSIFIETANSLSNNIQIASQTIQDIQSNTIKSVKDDIMDLNKSLSELQALAASMSDDTYQNLAAADKMASIEQKIASYIGGGGVGSGSSYYYLVGNYRIADQSSSMQFSLDDQNQLMLGNVNITEDALSGSVGAKVFNTMSKNNFAERSIASLDALSKTLITSVNAITANQSNQNMTSKFIDNPLFLTTPILDIPEFAGLTPGDIEFRLHTEPEQTVKINLNHYTTFADINSALTTGFGNEISVGTTGGSFSVSSPNAPIQILDKDNTNFSRILGFGRFFEGSDSKSIKVNQDYLDNPNSFLVFNENLQTNVNYEIASSLSDLQFTKNNFNPENKLTNYFYGNLAKDSHTISSDPTSSSFFEFYSSVTSGISRNVYNIESKTEIQNAVFSTLKMQYDSATKVDKDTELLNLMSFQNAYAANAKVMKALDEMVQTILNIK